MKVESNDFSLMDWDYSEYTSPSHGSLVWTGHHRRLLWPHLLGWAFPQCSHARPAGPPGAAGALARSGWGVGYLSKKGRNECWSFDMNS